MATRAILTERAQSGGALRRFGMIMRASVTMFLREKAAIFWVILFPILLMLLFGAIWGNMQMPGSAPNSANFVSYLAPGLIVLSLLSMGLIGNASTMSTYREKGILRRIQATPLPIWQLMLSDIVVNSTVMVLQAGLMIAVSILVFGAGYNTWGLIAAIPAIIFGAILFMAMGTAVAALVSKAKTAEVAAQVINVPLMFLGGLWTPISQLPDWLGNIAKFLPTSMVADLVRTPLLDAPGYQAANLPLWVSALGSAVYLVVSVVIAARFFKWR